MKLVKFDKPEMLPELSGWVVHDRRSDSVSKMIYFWGLINFGFSALLVALLMKNPIALILCLLSLAYIQHTVFTRFQIYYSMALESIGQMRLFFLLMTLSPDLKEAYDKAMTEHCGTPEQTKLSLQKAFAKFGIKE